MREVRIGRDCRAYRSVTAFAMAVVAGGLWLGAAGCGDDEQNDCGNGKLEEWEICDGENLGGLACTALQHEHGGFKYVRGELRCTDNCMLDESGCVAAGKCGNDVLETGEECDGMHMGITDCGDYVDMNGVHPFLPGAPLTCNQMTCGYDFSNCTAAGSCGNGQIEGGEECDLDNLAGQTCKDFGAYGGNLRCFAPGTVGECTLDMQDCDREGTCGDGQVQPAFEECEPGQPITKDCGDLGKEAGAVTCDAKSCNHDTTDCHDVWPHGTEALYVADGETKTLPGGTTYDFTYVYVGYNSELIIDNTSPTPTVIGVDGIFTNHGRIVGKGVLESGTSLFKDFDEYGGETNTILLSHYVLHGEGGEGGNAHNATAGGTQFSGNGGGGAGGVSGTGTKGKVGKGATAAEGGRGGDGGGGDTSACGTPGGEAGDGAAGGTVPGGSGKTGGSVAAQSWCVGGPGGGGGGARGAHGQAIFFVLQGEAKGTGVVDVTGDDGGAGGDGGYSMGDTQTCDDSGSRSGGGGGGGGAGGTGGAVVIKYARNKPAWTVLSSPGAGGPGGAAGKATKYQGGADCRFGQPGQQGENGQSGKVQYEFWSL